MSNREFPRAIAVVALVASILAIALAASISVPFSPVFTDSSNSKSCTDTTSTTVLMAGFKVNYTTHDTGYITISMNFEVTAPSGAITTTTSLQMSYGTGNAPACGGAATGTLVGDIHTVVAFKQTENVEITMHNVDQLSANTKYWFDIQTTDSDGSTWIFFHPNAVIIETVT
jgi:hypothetical protein